VVVAMSGGVDSSVAAALSVEAGHDVQAVMLRLWSEPGASGGNRCCTVESAAEAAAVAAALGVPFRVVDAAEVFHRDVVRLFVEQSAAGRTPNPCLRCNRSVRFGFLLDLARDMGADVLATGHYARVRLRDDGTRELLRGVDRGKDQSYVLHVLDQAQLSRVTFPVGDLPKAEVRRLAQGFGLSVASRADSVDLCWGADDGGGGVLSRNLPPGSFEPGPIETIDGEVIGLHRGLPFYTLGQRHGLGVSTGDPVYVVRLDGERNALVVGPEEHLLAREVHVPRPHWIAGQPPWAGTDGPVRVEAQIRYRAPAADASVEPGPDGRSLVVRFDRPQRAPTPGQALVAYRGEVCLGGGLIGDRR
jgi:tRNA-specific 2-thiouridylase